MDDYIVDDGYSNSSLDKAINIMDIRLGNSPRIEPASASHHNLLRSAQTLPIKSAMGMASKKRSDRL
jgi:hypothetical protein